MCLPDHLWVRAELKPHIKHGSWQYLADFFTVEEPHQFESECIVYLPTEESNLAVEPVVASTVKPRWVEDLKSNLGKYWQLPERRARRTRKQASYFSPC